MHKDKQAGNQNLKSTAFEDSIASAKKTAYKLLSYRDHSSHEVIKKLRAKGFSETTITQTLSFLKKIQLIDDPKFVREWSRFRVERDHYGPFRLRGELLKKGFSPEEIDPLVRDLSQEYDILSVIEHALTQRYKDLSELQEEKPRRRAFDYLRRKGHDTHAILAVFRKIGIIS